jgi:hypothetical protein
MKTQTTEQRNKVERFYRRCLCAAAVLLVVSGVLVFGFLLGAFAWDGALVVGLAAMVAGTLLLAAGFFRFVRMLLTSVPKKDDPEERG